MRVEPLGDRAFIVRDLDSAAHEFAAQLNELHLPGLDEAVAAYDTVGLYIDPIAFDLNSIKDLPPPVAQKGRELTIPVLYNGEDLSEAATRLNLTTAKLIILHTEVTYSCAAIGFCPGFAYLGDLSPQISGLPRRPNPRTAVPPGSVAITGVQTAVYPLKRPGGWWLIGNTPLTLVDVEDDYFPIKAGDEIRFEQIDDVTYRSLLGERL